MYRDGIRKVGFLITVTFPQMLTQTFPYGDIYNVNCEGTKRN